MLRNYFKIAWRTLLRNKLFSLIKILGLSIGLTACMLIFLYTKDEISYDRFHENEARLFRIIQTWQFGDNQSQSFGLTNAVLGESFTREIPEVQQFVRINGAAVTIQRNNDVFTEMPLFVDDNFFSVFSFRLIHGNKQTPLKNPYSMVISENLAKKYFGNTDVVGKSIQIRIDNEFENFTIAAVAETPPQNSTLKADMLLPFNNYEKFNSNQGWLGGSMNTFLLLSKRANTLTVERKMQMLFDKNTKDNLAQRQKEQGAAPKITIALQSLTDIHLSSKAGPDNGMSDHSKPVYSYILSGIAIFILIIACINFVNLAVAQSLERSKEIGVRKVVGGSRRQLIKQFLTESFLVCLVSFVLAIFLTFLILPVFNELTNKKLSFTYLSDGFLFAGFFLLLIVTSFFAGFYPSMVLSAFKPVKIFYGKQKLMGKNYLSRGLIILQFALSILLIIGTIIVNSQLNFLLNAELGYDSKHLVRIDIPIHKSSDNLPALFKHELENKPNVISVAGKNGGRSISEVKANNKKIEIEKNRIDERFLSTFKVTIIAGRNFSPEYPSDKMNSVLVNESFVKAAGWEINEALGKPVAFIHGIKRTSSIIGVLKDYHFVSLKQKITPALFTMDTNFNYGQVWVRINAANISQSLSLLQTTYKKLVPYFPYSYQFMDAINAANYEAERKWKQIISIASALFIFISCMGLLGLVILTIEQRTKEIGIRKILGAAISRIYLLISTKFLILISIAFAIAAPVGYYLTNKWLQNFAYRIAVSWWMFALAGILVLGIALLTISFQTIKAALANPVKSLRTE